MKCDKRPVIFRFQFKPNATFPPSKISRILTEIFRVRHSEHFEHFISSERGGGRGEQLSNENLYRNHNMVRWIWRKIDTQFIWWSYCWTLKIVKDSIERYCTYSNLWQLCLIHSRNEISECNAHNAYVKIFPTISDFQILSRVVSFNLYLSVSPKIWISRDVSY